MNTLLNKVCEACEYNLNGLCFIHNKEINQIQLTDASCLEISIEFIEKVLERIKDKDQKYYNKIRLALDTGDEFDALEVIEYHNKLVK